MLYLANFKEGINFILSSVKKLRGGKKNINGIKGTRELLEKGCYPVEEEISEEYEPVYEKFSGWKEDISTCNEFDELPENAKKYILAIEKYLKTPIVWIGVGPNRKNMIVKKNFNLN
ncbi:adenylosuccinate synthetase [Plasmodium falciparum 7G8]|uniref:Adenylosuccinate synthetase n=1 Tax=Plasmodium falciparum (isolate 7G8) TaxID=57266 RepID=W7FFM0_PLAF8|nr:adenylosuccinate synthetase [Plasmodium falciparum 7G8]